MGISSSRILLLYPNGTLMNPPPIAIGIFNAILKGRGYEVALFDSTLYPEEDGRSSDDAKQDNLQVAPFDFSDRGIELRESDLVSDLLKKVHEFNPDIIFISILECTYAVANVMLRALEGNAAPIIAGGVFPTFAQDFLFSRHENVTYIVRGEGEDALVAICESIINGQSCHDIPNICFRDKWGKIQCTPYGKLVDINVIPMPDYSVFESERFFRPMSGAIYKTIPIEVNRGCPYLCTFCNSPSTLKIYKDDKQNFFRRKSIDILKDEITNLVKQWDGEYVYFTSDNFLVWTPKEFDEFIEFYSDICLPFWIQTRPETIKESSIGRLKEVGLHRMSIGLEHGNEDFRIRVLKKTFDEDILIKASEMITAADVPLTVNNMIGFPGETRELVFDTINLNRRLTIDSINCSVFAPFHGTPLRKVCEQKGFVDENTVIGSVNKTYPLDMPQFGVDQIEGMQRTFVLYIRMAKSYWPEIQKAEQLNEEGDRILSELKQEYVSLSGGNSQVLETSGMTSS